MYMYVMYIYIYTYIYIFDRLILLLKTNTTSIRKAEFCTDLFDLVDHTYLTGKQT